MKKLRVMVTVASVSALLFVFLAPAVFAGGKAPGNGRILTKVTFIHFRKGHAKPSWARGGKKEDKGDYTYISKGARWRTLEDFVVNPSNGEGLGEAFVAGSMVEAMAQWESHGGQIFGGLYIDYSAGYNGGELDEVNTLSFGAYSDPNVIGVTTVWGYFSGRPKTREIVEADILFNDDYVWGDADVVPSVMDLLNIAVHEVGHCAGMGDLYESGAYLESMYGYSTEGETIKRDLYTGDVAGIQNLYQ